MQTVKLQPKNVTPLGMADGAPFGFGGGAPFGGAEGGGGAAGGGAAGGARVLSRAELEAMGVRELKALLSARGLSAEGCLEKQDFVEHVLLAQG